ncbi:ubiquitin carboxyl-terminal hydrolase 37-like [Amphibalanus amphitrite]|uniref:ubiquitin carboxyl-terminal hydrolase 37-like n=1 Tax=Amphibalanus amphitrite TaxID=1232801 RepID=UPI001C90B1C6|nr:ubiquitin carboxyl-terminal hydrolase 37-like [Amphibalanus amphitrite]
MATCEDKQTRLEVAKDVRQRSQCQLEARKKRRQAGSESKAQTTSHDLQLNPVIPPLDSDKNSKDPLYIGLPNYGNTCYQNATLQSLLGLQPFQSEMVSLISGPVESGQCRTLCGVAKLMDLRQKALSKLVFSHLNDLRDVFADIDPAFRGTEMQDANEFLLRLLDTMKDEVDARRSTDNPVRDNFHYQTLESYRCTKCHETVLKRQENISWFVSVPHHQGTEAPTLQDALRLSMRPDRRHLLCQHCCHDECYVTTKISQLPRTLILQLNRCVFLGDEAKKIRTKLQVLDAANSYSKPGRTREDKGRELHVIRRSQEREPAGAVEQVHLSEFCVQEDQSLRPVDLVGDSTYRLVGVISHYGGTAHSGHYVSDVYSVGRDMWFHYDDQRVSCVDEAYVLNEGHQRDGYTFFYLHKELCSQIVRMEGGGL